MGWNHTKMWSGDIITHKKLKNLYKVSFIYLFIYFFRKESLLVLVTCKVL